MMVSGMMLYCESCAMCTVLQLLCHGCCAWFYSPIRTEPSLMSPPASTSIWALLFTSSRTSIIAVVPSPTAAAAPSGSNDNCSGAALHSSYISIILVAFLSCGCFPRLLRQLPPPGHPVRRHDVAGPLDGHHAPWHQPQRKRAACAVQLRGDGRHSDQVRLTCVPPYTNATPTCKSRFRRISHRHSGSSNRPLGL